MNVWRSCYTISQIIDLGFNFGLNPPPTHIGGHIIELWWFFFHFWDRYFVLHINHSQVQKWLEVLKKKHFSVVQPNLKPNFIKGSSWAHHILHLYTRHYFPYNCLCNPYKLFMRMTKSQVKFIIMKNVLLKISKVPFNVFDPYTFWNELHYNSNFYIDYEIYIL
jgi:hypothetical protein